MKKLITRTTNLVSTAANGAAALAIAGTLALTAPTDADAQAKPGDYIIAGLNGRVMAMDPSTGSTRMLGTLTSKWANAVTMAPGNYWNYVVQESTSNDAVLQVSPRTGYVGTLARLPASGQKTGIEVDADGSLLVTCENGYLYRVKGSAVTTLASRLGKLNSITLDCDTGHYVVGVGDRKVLMRVDRRSYRATTLFSVGSNTTDVAVHPHTGHYIVTGGLGYKLQMFDRSGRRLRAFSSGPDNTVAIDHGTGDVVVAGGPTVRRFDLNLNAKWTRSIPYNTYAAGLSIYASRKLSGSGTLTKGSIFTIRLNFPESPGATYCGALSTRGVRPGIRVSGRKININFLDRLVYYSSRGELEGIFTNGINGTLSGSGAGTVQIVVPAFMPAGTNLYFVCNAVNRSKAGSLDLGNTMVIPAK